MNMYNSFEEPFEYSIEDHYIRAIRFNMIRRNGEIKISAFKSNRGGVSVTRTSNAVFAYAVSYMKAHFEGVMAMFPVKTCKDNDIYEKHSPSPGHNMHHWELYGDSQERELSVPQMVALMEAAAVV